MVFILIRLNFTNTPRVFQICTNVHHTKFWSQMDRIAGVSGHLKPQIAGQWRINNESLYIHFQILIGWKFFQKWFQSLQSEI